MKLQLSFSALVMTLLLIACGRSGHPPGREMQMELDSLAAIGSVETETFAISADTNVVMENTPSLGNNDSIGVGNKSVSGPGRAIASVGKVVEEVGEETPILKEDNEAEQSSFHHSQKTSGSIAFYCPKNMLENTASNVSVIISKDSLEKVKKLLEEKIKSVVRSKSSKEIHRGIEGHVIEVYEKMKVELRSGEGDMEVISKPENNDLTFDSTINEREWDWVIKAKRPGQYQLTLVVSAFNEASGHWIAVESPPRIFNITVKIDPRGYFVKLWGFLGDNPEWLFIQVLFPVIAYYVGKKRRR